MKTNLMETIQKNPHTIPVLIGITSVIAIVVNFYLLYFNHTHIFDSLFFVPIILVAYFYPRRGVFITTGYSILYLAMLLLIPGVPRDMVISGIGHIGIFIIVSFVVSYLSTRYPQEIQKPLTEMVEFSFRKLSFIPYLIVMTSLIAIVVNFYLLYFNQTIIFDSLFFLPIILIAYFYPERGVYSTTVFALIYLAMVLVVPGIPRDMVITSLGHMGIFIIIGFVVSYLMFLYSKEQEIHKRLAEIVVSSREAIIGKTLDGIITDWNDGAEYLYGYSSHEAIGKSISLLVPPDRSDELQFLLGKIRKGEPLGSYETERVTKDGRRIWISLSLSPIKDERGVNIGASAISHDITERKLAEHALDMATKKLQLLNSITRHDILNQITVLNIYHTMAENMVENQEALSYIRKAIDATDTISRQISFTHEYQDIGIKKPIWQNVRTCILNATAYFKNRPIPLEPGAANIEIYADPLLIEVFYQLIDNSLTHGEKINKIRFTHREDEHGLTLVYEDDGVGVPMEDKQKIFQKRLGAHSQLGLFLIREILAITGITITENGEPGKGARFEIKVPRGAFRFTVSLA
jgi:PAS domain S-box-containing protein